MGHRLFAPLPLPTVDLDPLWGQTRTVESKPIAMDARFVRLLIHERVLVWHREPGRLWGRYSRRKRIRLNTGATLDSFRIATVEHIMAGGMPTALFDGSFAAHMDVGYLRKGQTVAVTLSGRGTFEVLALVELPPEGPKGT